MKRIQRAAAVVMLLWLAMIPNLTVRAGGEDSAGKFVEIYTAENLAAIAENPEGRYRLAADIDMGGADWQPMAFGGILDGAGHTLYNLKVGGTGGDVRPTRDGNLKQYNTQFAGLFSAAENAEIVNLNIVGAEISVESPSHCFAGVLAGYIDRSTVRNCSVSGRVHMINHGVNAGVGGIAGYGCGDFENCRADVELVFEDQYLDGRCEQFMGGVLACGIGNITDCSVKLDGWDSCSGYVHNGGLVGMYYECALKVPIGLVNNNRVTGQMTFFENNPDRRAYCEPFIGERLSPPAGMAGNKRYFKSNEITDYSSVLRPEKCANPDYRETVTPPSCSEWGHTEHQCETCGYRWSDSYTPPAHTEGEWEIIREPNQGSEGLRQKHCEICGELLAEERIPMPAEEAEIAEKSGAGGNWRVLMLWLLVIFIISLVAVMAVKMIQSRVNSAK